MNSHEAMMIAKQNVEKYYPVVGITENMNMSLKVLEKKMPEYFEGGWDAYFNNEEVKKKRWKNNFKLPVSEEVRNILKRNMSYEIEFYEFCKQRLQSQYDQLLFKVPQ